MDKKRIPYGISNFKALIDDNMYYVDKTMFIENLEKKDKYQIFIRPRRFGKSLFLTMMETYYDINEAKNFERYFGNLYIGKNKTKEANKYLVLKLSFAEVITNLGMNKLIESFDFIVCNEISKTMRKYSSLLNNVTLPKEVTTAIYALKFLINETQLNNIKILLLIDEYDNFANNIMDKNREIYEMDLKIIV